MDERWWLHGQSCPLMERGRQTGSSLASDEPRGRRLVLRGRLLSYLLYACLALSDVAWGQGIPSEYVVREGDSCLGIVRRFGLSIDEFHRINATLFTTPSPHRLVPGTVLHLTPAPAGPDATLTFVRPRVQTRTPESTDWRRGEVGQDLYRLYRVATESGATTEVTFIDQTQLLLREESLLIIYGGTYRKASQQRRSGVELVSGTLQGNLAGLRGESTPLEVQTPAAKVRSSASDMMLDVDKQKTTRVAVYKGRATVTAQGKTVKVPQGNGTLTEKGKAPEPPRPLPPAPTWTGETARTRFSLNGAPVLEVFAFALEAPVRELSVEAATDEAFRDRFYHQKVPGTFKDIRLEGLTAGTYYLRISSVDDRGLQGSPSSVMRLHVAELHTARLQQTSSGVLEGTYACTLDLPQGVAASVNGGARSEGRLELKGVGTYEVLLYALEGAPERLSIVLKDVVLTGRLEPSSLPAEGGRVQVLVSVTDESGAPFPLEATTLSSDPVLEEGFRAVALGEWVGSLTVGEAQEATLLPLRLSLRGESQARLSLELTQEAPLRESWKPALALRTGGVLGAEEGTRWLPGLQMGVMPGGKRPFLLVSLEADSRSLRVSSPWDSAEARAQELLLTPGVQLRYGLGAQKSPLLTLYAGGGPVLHLGERAVWGSRLRWGAVGILGLEGRLGNAGVFVEGRYHYVTSMGEAQTDLLGMVGLRWIGFSGGRDGD